MKYSLFLDDYRKPKDVIWISLPPRDDWVIVRNVPHFQNIIIKLGIPEFISFDHDLTEQHYMGDYSDNMTGADAAKWLRAYCQKEGYNIPRFSVHSLNQDAPRRIEERLFK